MGVEMQDFFVEKLGNMVVGEGVIRLDFLRIKGDDPRHPQQTEPAMRVAMPLAAFAKAVDDMNTLRDQLLASGVLTRTVTGPDASVRLN